MTGVAGVLLAGDTLCPTGGILTGDEETLGLVTVGHLRLLAADAEAGRKAGSL